MENVDISGNKEKKSARWSYFFIGLATGFVLSISIFLMDKYLFNERLYTFNTFGEMRYSNLGRDTVTIIKVLPSSSKEDTAKRERSNSLDSLTAQVPETPENSPNTLDETEFSIEIPENEEVVVLDKVINNRKIKIQNKMPAEEALNDPNPILTYIDIQQWSTPIRNSMTYQRNATLLKIKGMDISKVEVYFLNGEYFLKNGNKFYLITNNNNYEKLIETELPVSQTP